VRADPSEQVLPLRLGDDFRRYEVTPPLVVDRGTVGVEVGGEVVPPGNSIVSLTCRFASVTGAVMVG
jgi:hypothetical protein